MRPAVDAIPLAGRPITVLGVAFPLAPVGDDTAGGAEQVLAMLDRALVHAGHRSIVVACAGSRCHGELVATPRPVGPLDERARAHAHAHHRAAIATVLRETHVDIIHMHGLDFDAYLPPPGPPAPPAPPDPIVLATLHLPPAWYAPRVFALQRPRTYLSCVSAAQRQHCPPAQNIVGVIDNGVDLDILRPGIPRGRYALALGRICPEKAFHRALDAARRADTAMLLGGETYPYFAHEHYFRTQILPFLDDQRRFIGRIGPARKRVLMAHARCVLVPSEAPETSSLVAMEALASGTPVITFGAGALADIVEHGRTGYVVADEAEMAQAIGRAHELDRAACRRAATRRFSADRMVAEYLELYGRLLGAAADAAGT